jgi:hypothetical protein
MGQATSVENHRATSPAIVCATKHVAIEWTIGDTKYTGALDLSTPETTASTGTHLLGKIRGSYGDSPPAKLKIDVRLAAGLSEEKGKNFARFAGFDGRMPPAAESIGRKIKFVIHPPWMCDGFGHIYDACLSFCRRAGIDFAWKAIAPPPPSPVRDTDAPGAPGGGGRGDDDDGDDDDDDVRIIAPAAGSIRKAKRANPLSDVAKYRKYIQSKITKAEAEIQKRNGIIASYGAVTNEHKVAKTAKTGFVADIAANKKKLAMTNPEIEASNDFKEYVARGRATAARRPARARAPAAPYVPAPGEGPEGNNNANQGGAAPPAAPPAVHGETEKDVEDLLKGNYPAFFFGDAPLVEAGREEDVLNRIRNAATRVELSAQIEGISQDLRLYGDEYVNLIVDILKSMNPEPTRLTMYGDPYRPDFDSKLVRITHLLGARSFLRAKKIFTPDGVRFWDFIFGVISEIPDEHRGGTIEMTKRNSIERDMRIMRWVAPLSEYALVPEDRADWLIERMFRIMHLVDAAIEERVAIKDGTPDVLGNVTSVKKHVDDLKVLLAAYLFGELRTDLLEDVRGDEDSGYNDHEREILDRYDDMERAYTRRHSPQARPPPQAAPAQAQATLVGGYKVSKSESGADDCIACTDMKRTMVAMPCGHISMCGKCATELVLKHTKQGELAKCPMCQTHVVGFYMTYQ